MTYPSYQVETGSVVQGLARKMHWLYIGMVSVLYVLVMVNTPIAVLPGAAHDDGLYMRIGRHIAEGEWLGPYGEYTLMKGAGYPAFLALANLLGLSVTMAQALFHCAAAGTFARVCYRWMGSVALSTGLFTLLLWEPVTYTAALLRVSREGIVGGQCLLVLATTAYALFGPSHGKGRFLVAAASGLIFGWFWLTREEGIWLVPGLVLVVAAAFYSSAQEGALRATVGVAAVALIAFVSTQVAYRGLNRIVYGSFVAVEMQEENLTRALGALHGIDVGDWKPFVSVTRAAREQIYSESPTFASIKDHLEGARAERWEVSSCALMPRACGEIGSGWFNFALREAVAAAGYFSSPAQSSAFYGRVADEINAGCNTGRLSCRVHLIAEMPRVSLEQVVTIPRRMLTALSLLAAHDPSLDAVPSWVVSPFAAPSLRLVNYPIASKNSDAAPVQVDVEPPAQTLAIKYSRALRATALAAYNLVDFVVLMLGLAAVVACVVTQRRRAFLNVCFVLGVASWAMVLTRVFLVALIDATSMPLMTPQYLSPANFLLVGGAALLITAAQQALTPGQPARRA